MQTKKVKNISNHIKINSLNLYKKNSTLSVNWTLKTKKTLDTLTLQFHVFVE